jgi:hypothetical protein
MKSEDYNTVKNGSLQLIDSVIYRGQARFTMAAHIVTDAGREINIRFKILFTNSRTLHGTQ